MKRGSILIAMIFVIVLSVVAVSFFFSLGGRTTLVTNQLKRAQAINCAEAALYEAFNKLRTGAETTATLNGDTINIPVAITNPTPPPAMTTYDVPVIIKVTGAAAPYTIEAEVDYGDVHI